VPPGSEIIERAAPLSPRSRWFRQSGVALASALLLCRPSGAQHINTVSDEPANASNPELPYWANDKFDHVRFMSEFTQHFILSRDPKDIHAFAFFPPVPPPLESEIPVLAPLDSGPAADPELSAFVGDVFYPLLGVRLAYGELSKPIRAQIVAYRDAKVALEVALHQRLVALKDADPATREAQLAALAGQQAPKIAELEAMAEKILADLRQIRVFGVPVEYTDLVAKADWRERATQPAPSDPAGLHDASEALRRVAFYEAGLSASQRHLLFEEAIELNDVARGMPAANSPGLRLLYFSPEGSRVWIPEKLPDSLEAKIAEYASEKKALKSEIRAALHSTGELLPGSRADALAKLGADEAPRFSALDASAEEIRRGLAALPNPQGPPAAPVLPADLTARIYAYRVHKVELLRKLRSMLASPTPTVSSEQASRGQEAPDPVAGALAWMHDGSSRTEVQSTELRVSVGEFDRLQSELIEALNKEENSIRERLAEYARENNGRADRKSVNDLLRDFEEARQRQELWDKYRDYETAVLEPGISAGQRRLLFDAAVEQLDLPLPAGDKID
jgi:hypothetical protein